MAKAEAQGHFIVVFDGRVDSVNIDLLVTSLRSTASIVQEINKEIQSGIRVNVSVRPFEKGSFEVVYCLADVTIADAFRHALSKDTIAYFANMIAVLGGLYKLKKFLAGKKPISVAEQENNEVKVESNNGTINITQNVYNIYAGNNTINESLESTFELINESNDIESYTIVDENAKEVFSAKKNEFHRLSAKNELIDDNQETQLLQNVRLSVFRIVFSETNKWRFIYKGNKVSGYIRDNAFFDRVHSGEIKFSEGDSLLVDLEIKRVFDQDLGTYINKEHTVIKVLDYIPRAEQGEIPFDEKDNND